MSFLQDINKLSLRPGERRVDAASAMINDFNRVAMIPLKIKQSSLSFLEVVKDGLKWF